MSAILLSIASLAFTTTLAPGRVVQVQTSTVPDTLLDSASAWPWRVLKRTSRLRQQEEVLVWLPADEDSSSALVVSCLGYSDYVSLAIKPPSPAAIEGVAQVGTQLGSLVTVSYRWEDGGIHRADFATRGSGELLRHVYRNPLSGCDDEHPCISEKLAHKLPEHRLLVAAWPNLNGGEDEETWTLPPSTGRVIANLRSLCKLSKH